MNTRSAISPAPQFVLPSVPRASLIAGVLLLLLLSPRPGLAQSPPVPHHPGHWTTLQPWNYEAIHMALLPGDGVNHHSRLLWWHGSPAYRTYLEGGLWGWNWSAGADACGSFGSFTSLAVNKAPFDNFCSGHSHLADGRLAVVGGTSSVGEFGIRNAAYFDPTAPAATAWSEVSTPMALRRWYPTVQLMPRGQITSYSGSSYNHMVTWGGTGVPGSAGQAKGDLHRLQLTEADDWDPAIPYRPPPATDWPSKRFGHSLAVQDPYKTPIMFGGRQSDGLYRQDTWMLKAEGQPLEADLFYFWDGLTFTGVQPLPRMEHSAVVLNDGSMIVYGGRDGSQVFDDVWRLYNDGAWKWEELSQEPATLGGPLPGDRFGQGALYQYSTDPPVRDRVLVYGGATMIAGQLADNDVWELAVDLTPFAHKAKWRKLVVETGSPKPLARYDHAMALDPVRREREQNTPCMWRMFVSGGRGQFGAETLSDEFWQLWDVDANTVAWSPLDAGPSRRAGHSLIYDGRHYLVLMGGETGGSTSSNEIWEILVACDPDNYGGSCQICGPPSYDPQWVNVTPASSPALYGQTSLFAGHLRYARKPERFTPAAGAGGTWEPPLNAPLLQEWYPYQFTIAAGPNAGKVFNAGPSAASYLLDPVAPSWSAFPTVGSGFVGGSAVLYRPDRVMKCGTRDTEQGAIAVRTTKYIVLDGASPAWIASGDMDSGRVNHNLTILPSGEVLVNGGTQIANNSGNQGLLRGLVELWRPPDATYYPNGVWYGGSGVNALEKSTAARDYHSVSLLLPDARVLCASGNASPEAMKAQIYCPPYLFNANGSAATRPVITSAPTAITYGQAFEIGVGAASPPAISSVCLMRPAAVTHGYNQDQRYIPLTFTPEDAVLRALAPANGRIAPPGDYLLFILNASGVPAVAKWVRLGQCPTIPCDTDSPPPVTDLYSDVVTSTSAFFVWTAPGDAPDAPSGEYDLRYATTEFESEYQYAVGWPADGEPLVGPPAGTQVQCTVFGLSPSTQYHFSLKTRDGSGSPYKNWSPLSNTVTVSTFGGWGGGGGGGGGGGYAARRADEDGEGGGSSASGTQSLPDQAIDAGASAAAGGGRAATGPAMTTSLDAGTGVLAAETRRTPRGGWQVTLRRLAQIEGVDATDAGAIVSQVPDGSGGWKTLGRFRPSPDEGPLGLCALRDQGRMVLPSGYALDRVVSGMRTGGQDLTLSLASHSRLGSLGGAFVDGGGGVEMVLGDALTLDYSPSSTTLPGAAGWYVVARPADISESAATPASHAPASRVPTRFALHQSHPNPSRRTTTIAFDLPVASPVRLEVFDLLGRRVTTLAEGEHPAGAHMVEYGLREAGGAPLRAGVYVYRLRAGTFEDQRKLTVLP